MRKSLLCLSVLLLTALAGCVTINVYFPKAAAAQAADQFIGSLIDPGQDGDNGDTPDDPPPAASSDQDPDQGMQPLAAVMRVLVPAAHAADTPNLRIHTPEVNAIHSRMAQRYKRSLRKLLDAGTIGYTHDGLVAVRDPSSVALSERAMINSTVAEENKDRKALYDAIAEANGHPEWTAKIRTTFAEWWIRKAHAGWYVQAANGNWKKK